MAIIHKMVSIDKNESTETHEILCSFEREREIEGERERGRTCRAR